MTFDSIKSTNPVKFKTSSGDIFNVFTFTTSVLKINGVDTSIAQAIGYFEKDRDKQVVLIPADGLYCYKNNLTE